MFDRCHRLGARSAMFWSTPVRTFDGPTHLPESIALAHLAQPRARQPVAGGNVLARAGVGGRVVALQWLQRPGWRQSSKPGLRSAGRYLGLCRHRPGCVDGSGAARYRLAYPGHHAGFCRRHDARRQFVLIDPAGHRSGTRSSAAISCLPRLSSWSAWAWASP